MYERRIRAAVERISREELDDYDIIRRVRYYNGLYRAAVVDGVEATQMSIRMLYVEKEAYRNVALQRGYELDSLFKPDFRC